MIIRLTIKHSLFILSTQQQLKQQRDKLKQYQKRIEQSLTSERELIKKCLAMGRKDRARMLLRKRKYQEKLLEDTDNQMGQLDKMASDIEFAQVELQVIQGLKRGNEALKKVHEILTIDEIEQVMDDTRESVDKQQELDEILSGALSEQDEDDVLAELEQLVADDEAKNKLPQEERDIDVELPDVPDDELEEVQQKERAAKTKKPAERVALEA